MPESKTTTMDTRFGFSSRKGFRSKWTPFIGLSPGFKAGGGSNLREAVAVFALAGSAVAWLGRLPALHAQ